MRTSVSLLAAVILSVSIAAVAQQSTGQSANPSGKEIQPQVWPPPAPAAGQNPQPAPGAVPAAPQPPSPTLAQRPAANPAAGKVQLDVLVTDKAGKLIPGLQRGDFTLLDNGRPAQIVSFQAIAGKAAAPDDSVQIVLAIDNVNVDFRNIAYTRDQIEQFLRQDGGRMAHPVTIVWVTDKGLQTQLGPSTDGNSLAAQLAATESQLRELNRSAGVWGAIERFQMSAQMLDELVTAMGKAPGRKLLIWAGAGWPMLDSPMMEMSEKEQQSLFHNIVQLNTQVREAQVEIYSVTEGMPDTFTYLYQGYIKGVKKPSQTNLPDLSLKVVAVQSGGQVMVPSNDLSQEIEKCAKDAGAYYRIGFNPPRADGPDEYHELKVKVDKPGLTARTNTGYYNLP